MKKRYVSCALAAALSLAVASSGYAEEQKAIYNTGDGEARGVRVTYNYLPDSHFKLHTQMGYVNDIELRPGEQVTYIAGGDTKRWLIDKAMVGNVQHVYIKPLDKGINTNIIINTNLRSYRFDVIETDGYDPLITFRFPDDDNRKSSSYNNGSRSSFRDRVVGKNALPRAAEGVEINQARLNFDYTLKAKKALDKDLVPLEVFDDGEKTFIRMSRNNKYDLPVIYALDPWDKKKLSMVNYRTSGDYYVIDRVMEHGRLFYHQNFYVDFYNEKVKAMEGTTIRQDAAAMKRRMLRSLETGEQPWVASSDERLMRDTANQEKEEQMRSERLRAREEARQAERFRAEREASVRQQQEQQAQLLAAQKKEQERIRKEQERIRKEREAALIARQEEQARLAEEQKARQEAIRKEQEKAQRERIRQQKIAEQARLEKAKADEEARLERARQAEAERIRLQKEAEKERLRQQKLQEQERARQLKLQEQERIRREEEQRRIAEEKARIAREEAARQEALRKEIEKETLRRQRESEKAVAELNALKEQEANLSKQIRSVESRLNSIGSVSPQQAVANRNAEKARAEEMRRQEEIRKEREAQRLELQKQREAQQKEALKRQQEAQKQQLARQQALQKQQQQQRQLASAQQQVRPAADRQQAVRRPLVAQPGNKPLMTSGKRYDDSAMRGKSVVLEDNAGNRRVVAWESLPQEYRQKYMAQMEQARRVQQAKAQSAVRPYDVNYEQYAKNR